MGSRSTHAQNPTSNAEHTHAAAPMPALHEGFRACVPQRSLSKPALHEGLRPSKHCTKDFVRDPSCVCDSVARTVSCVCATTLPTPASHEGFRARVCSAGPITHVAHACVAMFHASALHVGFRAWVWRRPMGQFCAAFSVTPDVHCVVWGDRCMLLGSATSSKWSS